MDDEPKDLGDESSSRYKFEDGYWVDQRPGHYARTMAQRLETSGLQASEARLCPVDQSHGVLTHVVGTLEQAGFFSCNVCEHCELAAEGSRS